MRRVLSVEVPAHGRVRFEPNGLHAMLIELVRPLKKGDRFPLTLMFQHAGPVRVEAIVQDLGTMTAPGGKDPDK
jgi:periplasmic copper chaperone A